MSADDPDISADGRWVTFTSSDPLLPGSRGKVKHLYVFDRLTGLLANVTPHLDDHANAPSISATGRFIAFVSRADNVVDVDGGMDADVFVLDLKRRLMSRVSQPVDGDVCCGGDSVDPSLSDDGRRVAFTSNKSSLTSDALDGAFHVYVRDLRSGNIARADAPYDGESGDPHLSADGSTVVFENIYDLGGQPNGEKRSRVISWSSSNETEIHNPEFSAADPTVSGDGRFVAFTTRDGVGNGGPIYLADRERGTTAMVSAGTEGREHAPVVTDDGAAVHYYRYVSEEGGSRREMHRWGRWSGATTLSFELPFGFESGVMAGDGAVWVYENTSIFTLVPQ